MATWPAALAATTPYVNGLEIRPDDPVRRTDMESGPARTRRIYTAAPSTYPVQWEFTAEEFAIFEAWHHYELLDGAAWFTVSLANGKGISSYEARMKQMWKAKAKTGLTWIVNVELEVRARPLMTAAELAPYL